MTRRFQFSLKALLVAMATTIGCVGSENALVDEKASVIDERLIGKWRFEDDEGYSFVVQKKPGSETVLETIDEKGEHHDWLLSRIGNERFLCVRFPTPDKEKMYIILRYEFRGDNEVQFHELDLATIYDAVAKGELNGRPWRLFGKPITVELTSTSAEIRAYLERHGEACFERHKSLVVARIE